MHRHQAPPVTRPAHPGDPVPSLGPGLSRFGAALFAALGLSFHVLSTPEVAGVELRLSLSDALLGVTGLYVVRLFLAGGLTGLSTQLQRSYLWIAGMFAVLLFAYLRTGTHSDPSVVWARIKLVGFVVLAAYFVVGSLLARQHGETALRMVGRGFVAGAWCSAALGLVEYAAFIYFDYPIVWQPRIAALAENPNAYGIMLAAALAMDFGTSGRTPLFTSSRLRMAGTAVMLVALFLSASRSAYLALLVSIVGMTAFLQFSPRQLLRPVVAAVALFVVLFTLPPLAASAFDDLRDRLGAKPQATGKASVSTSRRVIVPKQTFAVSREQVDLGVRVRIDLAEQATAMWWQHPWLGAGLGEFWRSQHARGVVFPYVNHNTALWLASETGLLGLTLFAAGIAFAIAAMVGHVRTAPLVAGVAGIVFVLIGASVGTEVTYQRYAWCFCGLALGLVGRRTRSDVDSTPASPGVPRAQ
jgi:O-antigen ligase